MPLRMVALRASVEEKQKEDSMATIIANGCFDIFHDGHIRFLQRAKFLGVSKKAPFSEGTKRNRLIVAVNSDESAKRLKAEKWGEKYPIDSLETRMQNVARYADEVVSFETEEQLTEFIEWNMPCIIIKGPDYEGRVVTGDQLAPVLILDTPEPAAVKEMKKRRYELA